MEEKGKMPIDQFAIDQVRQIRQRKGISQADLALELDVSAGFIGHVENPKQKHKYSLAQLNEIAKVLECSIKDFLPDHPL